MREFREYDNHEMVISFNDQKTGLRGYIAIHNSNLGPTTGGTRFQPYSTEADALKDALRLSQAMTYKCALAGLPFGGGKAVIIGDPNKKSPELLDAYARVINRLGGSFTTGTDVGMTDEDVSFLARSSPYMMGVKSPNDTSSTSSMAALGVFYAIEACLSLEQRPIKGTRVAVKGLGKLGWHLLKLLYDAGAELVVADIDPLRIKEAIREFPGIHVVDSAVIHKEIVDVYAPCAMGGELNAKTVNELNCRIVAGGANNQLTHLEIADQLHRRGILLAPDYVVNAGGLIHVTGEHDENLIKERVKGIKPTLLEIIEESRVRDVSPYRISEMIAQDRSRQKIPAR